MAIELYLILALAVRCQCENGQSKAVRHSFRITGGSLAAPNQFPYAAYITSPVSACTASIIGPRTILTAAHCLMNVETAEVFDANTLVANVENIDNREGRKIEIVESIIHPEYDLKNSLNDIGVLKTATDVTNGNVETACIVSHKTPLDQDYENTIALGWGYTDGVDGQLSKTYFLRFIELNVLKSTDCSQLTPTTTEGHLCTQSETGSVCNGDSGGPLSSVRSGEKDVIIGVASYVTTDFCTVDRRSPNVFTRVAAYESWIIQTAGEDGNNICRQ